MLNAIVLRAIVVSAMVALPLMADDAVLFRTVRNQRLPFKNSEIEVITEEIENIPTMEKLFILAGYQKEDMYRCAIYLSGTRNSFTVIAMPTGSIDVSELLTVVAKYCELRRNGFSQNFIFKRLRQPGGAQPDVVLKAFQRIVPGIVAADVKKLEHRIPSFPFRDPKDDEMYFVADSEVAIVCRGGGLDGEKWAVPYLIDRTDLDLHQDKTVNENFLKLVDRYLTKEKEQIRQVIFWLEWSEFIRKTQSRRWLSPDELNPGIIFE